MPAELTEEELDELREAFSFFDSDGDGFISLKEMEAVMLSLGHRPTAAELKDIMNEVDIDGDNHIDFVEFCYLMKRQQRHADNESEIIEAFKVFDRDHDGFITAEDLHHLMKNLNPQLTDMDYLDLVYEFDEDGDKKLNFEEFYNMMTAN